MQRHCCLGGPCGYCHNGLRNSFRLSEQSNSLIVPNSSKVGFHQELEDISVGTQHSITATTNGIFQSTLLYTHLKKSSVYRSVRVITIKRDIQVRNNVFCICFQLMIDSQDHQPSLERLHPPCISLLGQPYSQEAKTGCRAPWKKKGEDCSPVLQIPPTGLTEKEKRVSSRKLSIVEKQQN